MFFTTPKSKLEWLHFLFSLGLDKKTVPLEHEKETNKLFWMFEVNKNKSALKCRRFVINSHFITPPFLLQERCG